MRSGTSLLTTGNKMLFSHCSNIKIYKGITSRTIFHLIIKLQEGTDLTLTTATLIQNFFWCIIKYVLLLLPKFSQDNVVTSKVCNSVCGQHYNCSTLGLLVTDKTVVLMQQDPTELTT